jgi:hypothetical protein
MKIDIKPTLIDAYEDYHEFYPYKDEDFMRLGFPMNYFELDTSLEYGFTEYKAVVWVKGSEDELFEFIFTNEEVWKLLINAE